MTTNAKMTIYNKYTDENKNVIFKKHLIDEVFWDDSEGINLNTGYDKANEVNIYIPKNQNDMSGYVRPKKYKGEGNKWTLNKGDFIVKGMTEENEVTSIKELVTKYDDVFTITLVDDKDFGSVNMHHFEIRGK